MRVLALDTTTRAGSVALVDDDRVVEEVSGDPSRTHAERLPGEILALLGRHGLAVSDVDVFAVASGPGSFTGLRIGIATIQGLAFASGRPVVAVSALEALAQLGSAGLQPGALVAAWMDAHRREVFAALYLVAAEPVFKAERLREIDGPTVGDPAGMLARWAERMAGTPTWFIGDGTAPHGGTIRAAAAAGPNPPDTAPCGCDWPYRRRDGPARRGHHARRRAAAVRAAAGRRAGSREKSAARWLSE